MAQCACEVLGIKRLGGGGENLITESRLRDVQIAKEKAKRMSSAAWILGGGGEGRVRKADDNESMRSEESLGTTRGKSEVSGGSGPHATGQGAIYEDMEKLLGPGMTAKAQTTGL